MKTGLLLVLISLPALGSMSSTPVQGLGMEMIKSAEKPLVSVPQSKSPIGASSFVAKHKKSALPERQKQGLKLIMAGNVAPFSVEMHQIYIKKKIDGVPRVLALSVGRDFLAIGTDQDFLRFPLSQKHTLQVLKKYNAVLPTTDLVEEIYKQADKKLVAHPQPPIDGLMGTFEYYQNIDKKIAAELGAGAPSLLIEGHKKNLVLSKRLLSAPNRVAIYGWYKAGGARIQNLNLQHDDNYVDYAHGIRLVSRQVELDGETMDISKIFKDPKLSVLLTSEGPFDIDTILNKN